MSDTSSEVGPDYMSLPKIYEATFGFTYDFNDKESLNRTQEMLSVSVVDILRKINDFCNELEHLNEFYLNGIEDPKKNAFEIYAKYLGVSVNFIMNGGAKVYLLLVGDHSVIVQNIEETYCAVDLNNFNMAKAQRQTFVQTNMILESIKDHMEIYETTKQIRNSNKKPLTDSMSVLVPEKLVSYKHNIPAKITPSQIMANTLIKHMKTRRMRMQRTGKDIYIYIPVVVECFETPNSHLHGPSYEAKPIKEILDDLGLGRFDERGQPVSAKELDDVLEKTERKSRRLKPEEEAVKLEHEQEVNDMQLYYSGRLWHDFHPLGINKVDKRDKHLIWSTDCTLAWQKVADIDTVLESFRGSRVDPLLKKMAFNNRSLWNKAKEVVKTTVGEKIGRIKESRYIHTFLDGVLVLHKDPEGRPWSFFPFFDPEHRKKLNELYEIHDKCHSCNFHNITFPGHLVNLEDSWNGIDCAIPEKVMDDQKWNEYTKFMFYACMGRLLGEAGSVDDFQSIPYLYGEAGTGKSFLVDLIKMFYRPSDHATIVNEAQVEFAMGVLVPDNNQAPWFFVSPEMGKDYRPDPSTMKAVIAQETIAATKKNKDPLMFEVKIRGVFLGNTFPDRWFNEEHLSAFHRRLIIFPFQYVPKQRLNLMSMLKDGGYVEFAIKCWMAQLKLRRLMGKSTDTKMMMPARSQQVFREETIKRVPILSHLFTSGDYTFGKGLYLPWKHVRDHIKGRSTKWPKALLKNYGLPTETTRKFYRGKVSNQIVYILNVALTEDIENENIKPPEGSEGHQIMQKFRSNNDFGFASAPAPGLDDFDHGNVGMDMMDMSYKEGESSVPSDVNNNTVEDLSGNMDGSAEEEDDENSTSLYTSSKHYKEITKVDLVSNHISKLDFLDLNPTLPKGARELTLKMVADATGLDLFSEEWQERFRRRKALWGGPKRKRPRPPKYYFFGPLKKQKKKRRLRVKRSNKETSYGGESVNNVVDLTSASTS